MRIRLNFDLGDKNAILYMTEKKENYVKGEENGRLICELMCN